MTLDDLIHTLTAIRDAAPHHGALEVYRHDSPVEIVPVRVVQVEAPSPDDEIDVDQLVLLT